jgi:hypothetical protein
MKPARISLLIGSIFLIAHTQAQAPDIPQDIQIETCATKDAPEICEPARKACTEAMTNTDANRVLSPVPFIKNCIASAVKAGSLDSKEIAGHRSMYISAVHMRANSKRRY